MRKIIVYSLLAIAIVGLGAAAFFLGYLLMIAFFFCPIQSCWPQKIVLLLLEGSVIFCLIWLLENNKRWR
jgi:hypothetical protein